MEAAISKAADGRSPSRARTQPARCAVGYQPAPGATARRGAARAARYAPPLRARPRSAARPRTRGRGSALGNGPRPRRRGGSILPAAAPLRRRRCRCSGYARPRGGQGRKRGAERREPRLPSLNGEGSMEDWRQRGKEGRGTCLQDTLRKREQSMYTSFARLRLGSCPRDPRSEPAADAAKDAARARRWPRKVPPPRTDSESAAGSRAGSAERWSGGGSGRGGCRRDARRRLPPLSAGCGLGALPQWRRRRCPRPSPWPLSPPPAAGPRPRSPLRPRRPPPPPRAPGPHPRPSPLPSRTWRGEMRARTRPGSNRIQARSARGCPMQNTRTWPATREKKQGETKNDAVVVCEIEETGQSPQRGTEHGSDLFSKQSKAN